MMAVTAAAVAAAAVAAAGACDGAGDKLEKDHRKWKIQRKNVASKL